MSTILSVIAAGLLGDWLATLGLIFGGCCSNALTLEILTAQYAPAGSLITFAQFLLVSIVGLRKHLVLVPPTHSRQTVQELVVNIVLRRNKSQDPVCIGIYGVLASPEDIYRLAEGLATRLRRDHQVDVQPELSGSRSDENDGTGGLRLRGKNASDLRPSTRSSPVVRIRVLNALDESDAFDSLIVLQKNGADPQGLETLVTERPCMVLEQAKSEHFIVHHPSSDFTLNPLRYRLKARKVPLSRYFVHVTLFLLISLLNNAAFAYRIPMPVHIIFRSGGLVVNMLMGWLIQNRRYTRLQVLSILIVTAGIGLTTISSTMAKPHKPRLPNKPGTSNASSLPNVEPSYFTYSIGILILTAALVFSGFLGLIQDSTFSTYGRGHWEESMFYLHALALPMFSFVGPQLASQIRLANQTPPVSLGISTLAQSMRATITAPSAYGAPSQPSPLPPLPYLPFRMPTLKVPSFYLPLLANVLTQLVCVAGVNRLTSRVNSLTVTLLLVVRKAVSLAISVILVGRSKGNVYLWWGAGAVLLGTIGYSIASSSSGKKKDE